MLWPRSTGPAGLTAHPLPRGPKGAVLFRSHRLTEHPVTAQETEASYTTGTCEGKITFTAWTVFHGTKIDETNEEQISLSLPVATGWTAPHSPGAASAEAEEGVWGSGGTTTGNQDSSGPPLHSQDRGPSAGHPPTWFRMMLVREKAVGDVNTEDPKVSLGELGGVLLAP